MEHLRALIIKFIMCTAILWIILGGFYGVSFGDILTIGIVLTGLSYIVGDLYVLPRFENWSATVADFGLSFILIWILGSYLFEINIPLMAASGVTALFIAIGEYFFHKYMDNRVLSDRPGDRDDEISRRKLQTEFSSELDGDEQPPKDDDNRI